VADVEADTLLRIAVAAAAAEPVPVLWAVIGSWLLVYAAEMLVGAAAL
jgi:hypothetical protein